MKGEELVQSFKEERAAQRLQAEERLITNMEKAQRTMERYTETRMQCTITITKPISASFPGLLAFFTCIYEKIEIREPWNEAMADP